MADNLPLISPLAVYEARPGEIGRPGNASPVEAHDGAAIDSDAEGLEGLLAGC